MKNKWWKPGFLIRQSRNDSSVLYLHNSLQNYLFKSCIYLLYKSKLSHKIFKPINDSKKNESIDSFGHIFSYHEWQWLSVGMNSKWKTG